MTPAHSTVQIFCRIQMNGQHVGWQRRPVFQYRLFGTRHDMISRVACVPADHSESLNNGQSVKRNVLFTIPDFGINEIF